VKTGLEDKRKVATLGILAAVAGYFLYANVLAPSTTAPAARRAAAPDAAAEDSPAPASAPSPRLAHPMRPAERNRSEEFHPVLHSKHQEDQIDPTTVDPKIHLDLLAKLLDVPPAGSGRNLFQAGPPPPPKPAGPEPIIVVKRHVPGPPEIAFAGPPGPPPPAPLPPITFKYYGLTTVRPNGKRTAFFMAGEEILIRGVGDLVAGSYRLVSIGLTSAVVEDTQSKRQQTVPLAEEKQAPA